MSSAQYLSLNAPSQRGVTRYGDMRDYRAPSLFQPHHARQAIRDAHNKNISPLLGLYAGLPSVPIIRWLAPAGYDFVWIDWEHCAMSIETMTTMVHDTAFMSEGKTIPFVRIPGHGHSEMAFALDAGASIVAPHVDTVAQAKHVAAGMKYGGKNRGQRSAPPFRLFPGLTDTVANPSLGGLHKNLNNQAALMIQVESAEAVRNLNAILTEGPEIDIVWLGRLDARVDMGLPHEIKEGQVLESEWAEVEELYAATVKKHNKPHAGFGLRRGEALVKQVGGMAMAAVAADTAALARLYPDLQNVREALRIER